MLGGKYYNLNNEGKENTFKGRMSWLMRALMQKGKTGTKVIHLDTWKKDFY